MNLFIPSGHKIGKPVPLFTKIEVAKLEELKKKYGGIQQSSGQPAKTPSSRIFQSAAEAEKAVADQVSFGLRESSGH